MPEARTELDLGLNEGGTESVQRYEQDLLHLLGELTQRSNGWGRDNRKHLGTQKLEDFLYVSKLKKRQ